MYLHSFSLNNYNSKNIVIITIFKNVFRVIILKVDVQVCKKRLLNRYDVITGNEHNFALCESLEVVPDYKLNICPKEYKDIVEQDVIKRAY